MKFRKGDRVFRPEYKPEEIGTIVHSDNLDQGWEKVKWDNGGQGAHYSAGLEIYRPPVGTRVRDDIGVPGGVEGTIIAHVGTRKVEIEWDKSSWVGKEIVRYPFKAKHNLIELEDHDHVHVALPPKEDNGFNVTCAVVDEVPLFVDRVETYGDKDGSQKIKFSEGDVFMDGQFIGKISSEAAEENSDPDAALAVEEKLAEVMAKTITLPETRTESFSFEIKDLDPKLLETLGFKSIERDLLAQVEKNQCDYIKGFREGKRIGYAKGRSDIQNRDLKKIMDQQKELWHLQRVRRDEHELYNQTLKEEREYQQNLELQLTNARKNIRAHNISTGQLRDPDSRWTKFLRALGVIK